MQPTYGDELVIHVIYIDMQLSFIESWTRL